MKIKNLLLIIPLTLILSTSSVFAYEVAITPPSDINNANTNMPINLVDAESGVIIRQLGLLAGEIKTLRFYSSTTNKPSEQNIEISIVNNGSFQTEAYVMTTLEDMFGYTGTNSAPVGIYSVELPTTFIPNGYDSYYLRINSNLLSGTGSVDFYEEIGAGIYVALHTLETPPLTSTTGTFTLPQNTELTATAQDTLSSVMPYLLLFAGIPLGFYILYRITRLMPDNDKK